MRLLRCQCHPGAPQKIRSKKYWGRTYQMADFCLRDMPSSPTFLTLITYDKTLIDFPLKSRIKYPYLNFPCLHKAICYQKHMNFQPNLGNTCLTLTYLGVSMVSMWAQAITSTVPIGYFTLNIPAGYGNSSSVCVLSFPLQGLATASGQMVGKVTSITANTITNSNAAWTAGQLSVPATPYLLQITSGTAAGRTFLLSTSTANTATTVTLDPNDTVQTDLTTLGIIAGTDTYQIIPADTILSLFGTPTSGIGIVGGAGSSTNADIVTTFSGSGWIGYYYDTTANHWLRVGLPHIPGDNFVIRPDAGVFFNRFGTTPLTMTLSGQVPFVARQALVANNGVTLLSNSWPVAQTLGTSHIQNLPGWISGPTTSNPDTITLFSPVTGWRNYFYDGTNWRWWGPGSIRTINDSLVIPAGTVGYTNKQGTTSGYSTLTQPIPYSL